MTPRFVALGLVLAAILGSLLGAVTPRKHADATTTATIHVYAGVDYGGAWLTCGWHVACEGDIDPDRGLDFWSDTDTSGTSRAFFNGFGFTASSSSTAIGYMLVGDNDAPGNEECPATSVIVYSMEVSESNKRGFYYMHSDPVTTGWYTLYGKTAGTWNSRHVGSFAEEAGCYSDPHIMTWYAGFGTYDTTPRDPWYNCPLMSPYFECEDVTPYELPHDLGDWPYVTQYEN